MGTPSIGRGTPKPRGRGEGRPSLLPPSPRLPCRHRPSRIGDRVGQRACPGRGGARGGSADLARGTAVPSPRVRPPARPQAARPLSGAAAAGAGAQRAEDAKRRHSGVSAAPAPAAPPGGQPRAPSSLRPDPEALSSVFESPGCWASAACAACVRPEPGAVCARGRGRQVPIPRLLAEAGRGGGGSRCPGRVPEGPRRPVRMCREPWPRAWTRSPQPLCSAWPCGGGEGGGAGRRGALPAYRGEGSACVDSFLSWSQLSARVALLFVRH